MVGRVLLVASLAYVLLLGLAASEEDLQFEDLQKVMDQYMDDDEDLQAEVMDHFNLADDDEVAGQFDDEEVASQFDDEEAQRKFFTQLQSEMANGQSFSIGNQADLNRLLQATLPYLRSKLLAMRIPDQSLSSVRLSNIRITDVQFGSTSLTHNSQDTMTLNAYVTVLNGALNWRYSWKKWFVRIRKSGRLNINSGRIRMQISVRFRSGPPPSLESTACSINIGHLSLKIRGGIIGWILNRFRGKFARVFRDYLNRNVCRFLQPVLTREGTKALQRFAG